jgi:hypothetical protein
MDAPLVPRLLVTAALVAAVAGCAQTPNAARTEVRAAAGNLSVSNSKSPGAIFRADNIAPGQTVSGTVQLANRGTLAGDLSLLQDSVRDVPGPNGGQLSRALRLAVDDVTRPGAAAPVYSGTLAGLANRSLGRFQPGESRTYRFTARLPDGGDPPSTTGGDNAFAGSSLSVRYIWRTTAESAPQSTTIRLNIRLVTRRLLKRGVLDVYVRCDRPCRASSWAQLPSRKRGKKLFTRPKSVRLAAAGKRGRIRIRVSRRSRAAINKRIRRTRRLPVRVYVRATDGAGNTRTVSKKFTIRRVKFVARR